MCNSNLQTFAFLRWNLNLHTFKLSKKIFDYCHYTPSWIFLWMNPPFIKPLVHYNSINSKTNFSKLLNIIDWGEFGGCSPPKLVNIWGGETFGGWFWLELAKTDAIMFWKVIAAQSIWDKDWLEVEVGGGGWWWWAGNGELKSPWGMAAAAALWYSAWFWSRDWSWR